MIFAAKRSHARLARRFFFGALFLGGLPNGADDDALRANWPGINSA
jgi:hypothetical protein